MLYIFTLTLAQHIRSDIFPQPIPIDSWLFAPYSFSLCLILWYCVFCINYSMFYIVVWWGYREILQEIQRLRLEHEQASQPTPEKAQQNPTLLAELRLLRYVDTHTRARAHIRIYIHSKCAHKIKAFILSWNPNSAFLDLKRQSKTMEIVTYQILAAEGSLRGNILYTLWPDFN